MTNIVTNIYDVVELTIERENAEPIKNKILIHTGWLKLRGY